MSNQYRRIVLLTFVSLGLVACVPVSTAPGAAKSAAPAATAAATAPAQPTVAATNAPGAASQAATPIATEPTAAQPTAEATKAAAQAAVTINNFAFAPQALTVKVGTTVTWTNQQGVTHTTTSDTGEWDSKDLGQGQSFSFTFTNAGTYAYHCAIHSSMTGTITVTD